VIARPATRHARGLGFAPAGEAERGSGPAEFVLVGGVLTLLTLGVMQLGLAIYVRNVVHDAAVEGAHHAALADAAPGDGAERARLVISRAVGAQYAEDIAVSRTTTGGVPSLAITVRTTLPLIGLLGVPAGLEVTASAPLESLP